MRNVLQSIVFFLTLALGAPMASAWYVMPPASQSFPLLTGAVEVTVQGFDQEGVAVMGTHQVLWGQDLSVVGDSATYACTRGSWEGFGMQEGKRYVLLLTREGLLSDDSFFEITATGEITLPASYQTWFGAPTSTWTRADLQAHLHHLATLYDSTP